MARYDRGILVTGGGTFLGDHIAAALLAEGADVSLLLRTGAQNLLEPLMHHTNWSNADVWNPASLRGKARYHSAVIHTVGSLNADQTRGLSYQQLNSVSLRNVANMCVSDGVERLLFISSAGAPWMNREYLRSKRDAESYLRRVGLRATIVRAPLLYVRGQPRPLFYRAISLFGSVPPLSWLPPGRSAPMPIDVLARGVARLALNSEQNRLFYFSRDLRRLNTRDELRSRGDSIGYFLPQQTQPSIRAATASDDLPFGWTPGNR